MRVGPGAAHAGTLLFVFGLTLPASAEPACRPLTRQRLVECALAGSPQVRAAAAALRAADGRLEAARPFLPSNPTLSASLGSRTSPRERAVNWSVSLGQELELAGQSWLRTEVAVREREARTQDLAAMRAAVATAAWVSWFTALLAEADASLATTLERSTGDVAATARGMASAGVLSRVDAAVAEAAATRASRERISANARRATARAALARLLGLAEPDLALDAPAPWTPLPVPAAPLERPELLASRAELLASEEHLRLAHRSRLPNPTVSLFAQLDGFDEQVLGVGLALPLPVPEPVGRTGRGELELARAEVERARAAQDGALRDGAQELAQAHLELAAAEQAVALFTPRRLEETREALDRLSLEVKAGRLPVREALVSQQALIELLRAELEARYSQCIWSVRLARASGGALEGGAP